MTTGALISIAALVMCAAAASTGAALTIWSDRCRYRIWPRRDLVLTLLCLIIAGSLLQAAILLAAYFGIAGD